MVSSHHVTRITCTTSVLLCRPSYLQSVQSVKFRVMQVYPPVKAKENEVYKGKVAPVESEGIAALILSLDTR